MCRLKLLVVVSLVLTSVWASSAAAQGEAVARTERRTPVAAFRGVVAWSAWSPSHHRYRLMVRRGGQTERARVGSRAVDFDPDVGMNAAGRTVVVYSRCRREVAKQRISAGLGCDIFSYDVRARRESRLQDGVSTSSASETHPSIAGRSLAFVRVFERRRGRAGVAQHLLVRRGSRTTEIDRVRPNQIALSEPYRGGRRPAPPVGYPADVSQIDSVELDGHRLIYEFTRTTNFCPNALDNPEPIDVLARTTELRQVNLRASGRRRVVDSACSNARRKVFLFGSTADQGRLAFAVGVAGVGEYLDVLADGVRRVHFLVPNSLAPADLALDGEAVFVSTSTPDYRGAIVSYTLSELESASDGSASAGRSR